jgi:hypothetical protein
MKFAVLSLILAGRCAFAAEPTFEAWSYTGTDIYPSALIATATVNWHEEEENTEAEPDEKSNEKGKAKAAKEEPVEPLLLGDANGWVGARIFDVPKGAKISCVASGDGWLKPSKVEVTVEEDAEEIILLPKSIFDYDALHKIKQQKPANLNIKLSINGKALPEQNETITLRSINECPFYVLFGEDQPPDDLTWMFAAYVNENHPKIDAILKEALDAELVPAFDGYQSGDPEQVIAQIYAIWNIMQRHGIKYSDITNTPKSKFAAAQTVRFLDDSMGAAQANCVDGSVIFASILTKLSIKCALVLIPGHCFVCFDLDPDGELDPTSETCLGLETTLMGSKQLKPVAELKKLPAKVKAKVAEAEGKASADTFLNAIGAAAEVFAEHGAEFDQEDSPYQIIRISDAREMGIMPIAADTDKK